MSDPIVNRHSDALIVVDVQNDFCPGGALAVDRGDAIVPAINDLSARFAHVLLTQDWHPRDHKSFASNHRGAAPFGYGGYALRSANSVAGPLRPGHEGRRIPQPP